MKKEQVAEHFRNEAGSWVRASYEGSPYDFPTAEHRRRVICRLLDEARAPLKVLDLGCGGGHLALALAERGHTVFGIDQSPQMIGIATAARAEADAETQERLVFREGDIESAEIEDTAYDVVTAMGVIGYFPSDDPLLACAARALKPEGRFMVSCRNRLFNMTSHSHRTVREIENGTAPGLLAELDALRKPVAADAAQEFVAAFERALPALKADVNATPSAPSAETQEAEAAAAVKMGTEARQHTPAELTQSARAHGFETQSMHGIHPHLINPALNRLLPPGVFNTLSGCLEALEDEPISLSWSSVFIASLRKRAS